MPSGTSRRANRRPCSTPSGCSTRGPSIAATDLRQRRFGLVLKLLLESVLTLDQQVLAEPSSAS